MKNYFLLIIGIIYFSLYGYFKDTSFVQDTLKSINHGEFFLSYINSFVGIITALGVIGIVNKHLKKIITTIFSKTKSKFDDIIGEFIIRFFNIAKYIIAIYVGVKLAIIPENISSILDKGFNISFIIIGLILVSSLVNSIFSKISKGGKLSKLSKQVFPLLGKIVNAFIWIIGGITILGNLGYDISALITGAGIGGLAIALAAKTSVSNIFGAISIIINKPFSIGDRIAVNGHTGKVKDIGLTYLTLTDDTGYKILIPNENIISSTVENLAIRENRRTDFSIGVIYGTTNKQLEKGVELIKTILQKELDAGNIINYRVNFDSFGDFSLNINVSYFSLINEDYTLYLEQKERINLSIKDVFEKNGLEMAFPTQEIIVKRDEN